MIGVQPGRLALIPAEFSGHARIVGCPWCKEVLMLVMNESGMGTDALEVVDLDLAESQRVPGTYSTKGGWVHATPHRCRESRLAYARSDRHAR
jgi:hypothetical protein